MKFMMVQKNAAVLYLWTEKGAWMHLRRLHAEQGISASKVATVLGVFSEEANRMLADWEREDVLGDF